MVYHLVRIPSIFAVSLPPFTIVRHPPLSSLHVICAFPLGSYILPERERESLQDRLRRFVLRSHPIQNLSLEMARPAPL